MMRRLVFSLCLAILGALTAFSVSSADSMSSGGAMMAATAPTIVPAGSVKWTPVKGMAGLEEAILWGDPTKAGAQYALRYRCPNGFKFPPHTHTLTEQVTVVGGELDVALGKTFDATKLTALRAGSYFSMPPNVWHFGMCKGDTVVQINGIGPASMNTAQ